MVRLLCFLQMLCRPNEFGEIYELRGGSEVSFMCLALPQTHCSVPNDHSGLYQLSLVKGAVVVRPQVVGKELARHAH